MRILTLSVSVCLVCISPIGQAQEPVAPPEEGVSQEQPRWVYGADGAPPLPDGFKFRAMVMKLARSNFQSQVEYVVRLTDASTELVRSMLRKTRNLGIRADNELFNTHKRLACQGPSLSDDEVLTTLHMLDDYVEPIYKKYLIEAMLEMTSEEYELMLEYMESRASKTAVFAVDKTAQYADKLIEARSVLEEICFAEKGAQS